MSNNMATRLFAMKFMNKLRTRVSFQVFAKIQQVSVKKIIRNRKLTNN